MYSTKKCDLKKRACVLFRKSIYKFSATRFQWGLRRFRVDKSLPKSPKNGYRFPLTKLNNLCRICACKPTRRLLPSKCWRRVSSDETTRLQGSQRYSLIGAVLFLWPFELRCAWRMSRVLASARQSVHLYLPSTFTTHSGIWKLKRGFITWIL